MELVVAQLGALAVDIAPYSYAPTSHVPIGRRVAPFLSMVNDADRLVPAPIAALPMGRDPFVLIAMDVSSCAAASCPVAVCQADRDATLVPLYLKGVFPLPTMFT